MRCVCKELYLMSLRSLLSPRCLPDYHIILEVLESCFAHKFAYWKINSATMVAVGIDHLLH